MTRKAPTALTRGVPKATPLLTQHPADLCARSSTAAGATQGVADGVRRWGGADPAPTNPAVAHIPVPAKKQLAGGVGLARFSRRALSEDNNYIILNGATSSNNQSSIVVVIVATSWKIVIHTSIINSNIIICLSSLVYC